MAVLFSGLLWGRRPALTPKARATSLSYEMTATTRGLQLGLCFCELFSGSDVTGALAFFLR